MPEYDNWNQQIIAAFRANGGRDVPQFGDSLLLLTTIGAKSGQERLNPLVYSKNGDRLVIVASKAGAPTSPDWYHNLVKNPVATVELGTEKFQARATEIKGEQRNQLYAAHAAIFPGFNDYQKNTTRTIPVVELERIAS